ncbi:MAG TPA: hypothetical protein VEI97_09155 [bacterium]|nr:hypothetical protein [bacterium]
MAYAHGYNAFVTIDAISLCVTKWSVQTKVDEVDVTNSCTPGFVKYLPGASDADISLEGVLGDGAGEDPFDLLPFRDLADIHVGGTASILIAPDNTLNPAASWQFPTALITGWSMEASPRDAVRYTLTAKANGVYVEPNM